MNFNAAKANKLSDVPGSSTGDSCNCSTLHKTADPWRFTRKQFN